MKFKRIETLDKLLHPFGITSLDFEKISSFLVLRKYQKKASSFEFGLIVGCPRSGTTLIESIVSTHPKVISPLMEINFSSYVELQNFLKKEEWDENENLDKFFERYSGNKYLILKRPTAIFYLSILKKFFPKLKVIIVKRNEKDTISSLMKSHHFRWSFDFALSQVKRCNILSKKYKNKKDYLEISYEEVIKNPEKINRIFEFLGLSSIHKKNILNFYKKIDSSKNLPVKNARSPISKKHVGKGKKNLFKSQLKIIESKFK